MLTVVRSLLLLILVSAAYWFILRPWHTRWGTLEGEADAALPGDSIVPNPTVLSTHAITINAPVSAVWPWLLQIGQEKGGLYSYEWLENLIGCDIHNATAIVPEWQNTQVGDKVRLGPKGYPLFVVNEIVPNKALILQAADPQTEQPATASWAFILDEQADGTTRFFVRNRNAYETTLGNFLLWRVMVEPGSFVMEQKMMRSIKELVEAQAVQHQTA